MYPSAAKSNLGLNGKSKPNQFKSCLPGTIKFKFAKVCPNKA